MQSNLEKNNDNNNNSATNKIRSKRSNLPRSVYIERMILIVYNDVKFHNQSIKTFDRLAERINQSFEEGCYYTVPFVDTGKDYIREYVRTKRKELEKKYKELGIEYTNDGKVNNSYEELVYFCNKDYVTNYIINNEFFENFSSCDNCCSDFPDAVLFVKRKCENLISDFLLDDLNYYVKATIIGNGCLQVYFHDYNCRSEFFDMFFINQNQSNIVDDIDDSDDKTGEKEKT